MPHTQWPRVTPSPLPTFHGFAMRNTVVWACHFEQLTVSQPRTRGRASALSMGLSLVLRLPLARMRCMPKNC